MSSPAMRIVDEIIAGEELPGLAILILLRLAQAHQKDRPLILGIRAFSRDHHKADSASRKAIGLLIKKGIIRRVDQAGGNAGRKAQFEVRGVHFDLWTRPLAPGSKPRLKPELTAIDGGRYARRS